MPQFDLYYFPSQVFWLIVVFGCLYIIISKFISPKAEDIFSNRKIVSEDNIARAELLTLQASKLKSQYEADYHKIWEDAKALNAEAIKKLNEDYEQQKIALAKKLSEQEKSLHLIIDQEVVEFKGKEQDLIISLAQIIIEKIIPGNVDKALLENICKNSNNKA